MSGMTITAAVDGSSLGNPGPAGWAWVVDDDHWDAGGWPEGTNNLGELTAVLELLKATEAAGLGAEKLRILADSQYAINVVAKWRHGWKKRGWAKTDKKPIKNLELIQEIDRVIEGRDVEFEWVKGHAGHAMNERADDLARGCAEAYQAGRTPAPGPAFGASSSVSSSIDEAGAHAPDGGETGSRAAGLADHDVRDGRSGAGAPASSIDPRASAGRTGADGRSAAGSEAADPSILDLEKRFIRAWAGGDTETLAELGAPDAVRVWPDGHSDRGLGGPVPPGLAVSRLEATEAGTATLVRYGLRWEGGASAELSVWSPDPTRGPVLVHHQSTPIL